ncbi:YagK/YfjJ domain-containing protein [Duganella violaceipulchra]|uniref:Inovirus Gp2 family protein n=1 Tax=Duganella violaceipulchra TaxID=2849652 RepID=A0AA41HJK7_9BURK|nr:inovirus-type Gp2 protein [Duganella violaceicalia]MBV6325714.1 inovirus Gp2 family protein [Duganella violaceicalia]MCP2012839.1 hypothetical protein [Duganella violaceicalia]
MKTLKVDENASSLMSDYEMSVREIYRQINAEENLRFDSDGKVEPGLDYGNTLFVIEEFVGKILSSNSPAFVEGEEKFTKKRVMVPTKLGKKYLDSFHAMVACYGEQYEYSEHVKVFFDTCKSMSPECKEFDAAIAFRNKSLGPYYFNKMFEDIRRNCNTKKFKRKIAIRKSNFIRNFASVKKYIDALFNRYSRLLVLRVDLSYKKSYAGKVDEKIAHSHREQFLNNMRSNSLFDNLVGYVWKLEYGRDKGHHFHFAFFFDGAKVRKDEFIALKIGNYWVNKITDGNGSHHNCNMNKAAYEDLGIGMISHDEHEKRKSLMRTLSYLTKKDQYLRKRALGRCRIFGKGVAPAAKVSGLGRPRRSAE